MRGGVGSTFSFGIGLCAALVLASGQAVAQQSCGALQSHEIVSPAAAGPVIAALVADFDRDGRDDIAALYHGMIEITLVRSDGTTVAVNTAAPANPTGFAAAD